MMQWIERTETAARSMQSLIEEMLVLSNIESAEHKIELETLNISEMAEMITLLIEPIAYEKKIDFQTAIAENIYVQGNEEYLKRVFLSLIENAIKYEPDGGAITVSLSLQQNKAVFLVNNRLAIISAEELPYIFERFYRSDKSRHGSGGHGLGLAIAKRILDVMNGKIEVKSSKDIGTTFQVTLKSTKAENG